MTPGARVQAAIEVLDRMLAGDPAERALTAWARGSRYAGSKDRAAVRDHVFDAVRMLRSGGWAAGLRAEPGPGDGRAVIAGTLMLQGADLPALFSGQGHAPAPFEVTAEDQSPLPDAVALDVPDWLLPILRQDLGPEADAVLLASRTRAPVFLRANLARITRDDLVTRLSEEQVEAVADETASTALRLTGAPRGLTNLASFQDGLWELQDAGSQALVGRLPPTEAARVLDLCAGGGGKALAVAARGAAAVFAHDADPARMRDLPARAARAGAEIEILTDPESKAPFDAVIADVPCSGSGTWRRSPDAKWRLTPDRLTELNTLQLSILRRAVDLVRPGGWIGYMTCSILARENAQVVESCVADRSDLLVEDQWTCLPRDGGPDGFHLSVVRRSH